MADTDTTTADGEGTVDDSTKTDGEATGGDLQAEVDKWKAMARKHEGQAKQNAAAAKRLAELEDASKSDVERATAAATAAEKRAEAAELKASRYEVALDKGVPAKLMKFLTGSSVEEIEASADELLEAVGAKPGDAGSNGSTGKPKEKLVAGAASDPDDEPEKPLAEVLAAIPRS